jgi:nicotinamide mononucleotide transporter
MFDFQEWLTLLREQFFLIDIIQVAVLILGVSEVLLARANNIWLYPTGIAATTLGTISLFNAALYAECMLHMYYIVMSIYGWWYWIAKKDQPIVPVTFSSRNDWTTVLVIVFFGWAVLYFILTSFTSSDVPVWDAWVSSTAWAGMWLLARRKVENWLLLNLSNAFAIPLLIYKALPFLALLTLFLFVVACFGYYDWIKIARRKREAIA